MGRGRRRRRIEKLDNGSMMRALGGFGMLILITLAYTACIDWGSIVGKPEIVIKHGTTQLSLNAEVTFDPVVSGQTGAVYTFIISNPGVADLELLNGVKVSSDDSSMFQIVTHPRPVQSQQR